MISSSLLSSLSRLNQPLRDAIYLSRPHRFALRVWLPEEEEEAIAHLGDPGRLTHLLSPGTPLKVDGPFSTPQRKTDYTTILAQAPSGVWVSLVTQLPNRLFESLLLRGHLPSLWRPPLIFPKLQREVTFGKSRIDAMLSFGTPFPLIYIECKSVTWAQDNIGYFPDSPTTRGQKHIQELIQIQHEGHRACALFIAGREDIQQIQPASDIDPIFSSLLKKASLKGVELLGVSISLNPEGVDFCQPIEIVL